MNNPHKTSKEGYHCPDKGNMFPLRVYEEASGRFVDAVACPGCGADLKTHCVRVESPPVVEDQPSAEPAPVPASNEPAADRQARNRGHRGR